MLLSTWIFSMNNFLKQTPNHTENTRSFVQITRTSRHCLEMLTLELDCVLVDKLRILHFATLFMCFLQFLLIPSIKML